MYFGSDRDTLRFWVVIDEEVSPEPSEVYRLRGHLHLFIAEATGQAVNLES
ncbi:MAG: hypothetical protein QME76_11245 [Bacillota bacterium]|nr:hypothetical protein [Bacillota bacterium]